ncbi:MAG: hypothetical protein FJ278_06245, partial [Planctomycetes bacterium]|nr:hypothetical protein [Planctomycetota bacterium]
REDPDIVLVGEMRDLETVSIAIETAETGHLVFGTLHTTTAASTVDRIIDQFPEDRQEQIRLMLSSSLKAVIAQTLCRKIGGGRIAALEILIVTSGVSNLIREKKTFQIPSTMQTGKGLGMQALNDELVRFVQEGLVESEEAYVKAVDKLSFVTSLNNMLLTRVQNGEITCEVAIQQAITKKDMLTLLDKSGYRGELKKLVKMASTGRQPMEALQ